jgi:hypothetical protein
MLDQHWQLESGDIGNGESNDGEIFIVMRHSKVYMVISMTESAVIIPCAVVEERIKPYR